MGKCIFENGYSKSRESKYTKIVKLYWHVRELIACVIESRGTRDDVFPQKLDQLNSKYEALITPSGVLKLEVTRQQKKSQRKQRKLKLQKLMKRPRPRVASTTASLIDVLQEPKDYIRHTLFF